MDAHTHGRKYGAADANKTYWAFNFINQNNNNKKLSVHLDHDFVIHVSITSSVHYIHEGSVVWVLGCFKCP